MAARTHVSPEQFELGSWGLPVHDTVKWCHEESSGVCALEDEGYTPVLLESITADIRFTLRWLRKSPGFALVAIASLAIGIGFNTALFALVDAVLFKPLPVTAPE